MTRSATSLAPALLLLALSVACGGGGAGQEAPPPGGVTVSGPTTVELGTAVIGAPVQATVTLTSDTAQFATLSSRSLAAPFAWKGGAFPGTGGTCGATLTAGASCTVVVTFAPTSGGAATGTLAVDWTSAALTGTAQASLHGTGATPAHLAATQAAFGTAAIGAAREVTVTVANDGDVAAGSLVAGSPAAPFAWKGGAYPGAGGTCGSTLGAGLDCTLVLTFAPSAATVSSAAFSLSYATGATAANAAVSLTGTGAAPATLAADCGPTLDMGFAVTGATAERTITLQNMGGVPATGLAEGATLPSAFDWKGGVFPGAGGTCGGDLPPLATCSVVVTFMPVSAGAHQGSVAVAFGDGVTTRSAAVDLAGASGAPALLAVSDGPTYDFGSQAVNATVEHVFTVTNGGGVSATSLSAAALAAPFAWKGGAYPGTGGTCGNRLPALSSCTLVVTYHPTGAGAAGAAISLGYQDGASLQAAARALSGAAVSGAFVAISGATGSFGPVGVGSGAQQVFTLTNTGALATTGLALAALPAGFAWVSSCPFLPGSGALAPGASCTVTITFSPAAATAYSGQLTVSYGDGAGGTPQATRALDGTGTTGPALRFDGPASYDFLVVAVGGHADATFTLRNTGGAAAGGLAVGGGLSAPFSLEATTCAASLAAGATCTATVRLAPAAASPAAGTLAAAATGASAQVGLVGTGALPARLVLSEAAPVALGDAVVGTSGAARTLTIQNQGGVAATGLSGAAGAPVRFVGVLYPGSGGTCGATLAPGDACTIAVELRPSAAGAVSRTVTLSYVDGVAPALLAFAAEGAGQAPASLAFVDGPSYAFPGTVAGGAVTHDVVVSNGGGVPATGLSGAALAAPFSYEGGAWPGTGGSCGASLAAGASCSVRLRFAPSAAGAASGSLGLAYQDGAAAALATLGLGGQGLAPAALVPSGASAFSDTVIGTRLTGVVTLTNDGAVTATNLSGTPSAPWVFTTGAWPGGGTCGASLAPGASCTVKLDFAPSQPGSQSGTLGLAFGDGVTTRSASQPLSGRALAPARLVFGDGAAFDFGVVASGATATHLLAVTNAGEWPASLGAVTLGAPFGFSAGAWPGFGGDCGSTLAPGATCRAVLAFQPAQGGPAAGTLAIPYGDGVGTTGASLAVSGTGTELAHLVVTDWPMPYYTAYGLPADGPALDFGAIGVGATAEHVFSVTNTGKGAATLQGGSGLSAPYAWKGGAFPGAGGTCAGTLAADASCTVVVTFSPASAATATQTLSIAYQDGQAAQAATRAVTGAGVATAALSIFDFEGGVLLGAAWPFGSVGVGNAVQKEFYVRNGGAAAATGLAGAALPTGFGFAGGAFPGQGGSCPDGGALDPGATCLVVVSFAPVAAGPASATLTVQYGDGSPQPRTATRDLTGAGVTTALLVTEGDAPVVIDLGVVGVGQSRDVLLRVRNLGAAAATAMSPRPLSPPFSTIPSPDPAYPTCGATLAPGAACGLAVRFAPSAAGLATALPGFDYQDGAQAQVATHALRGTGTTLAYVTVRDWSSSDGPDVDPNPYDFGVTGQPTSHDFVVSNTGAQAATALAADALAAPFSVTSTTCGPSLAAGATCTVRVTFTPSGDGAAAGTLRVRFGDGSGPASAARDFIGASTSRALLFVTQCYGGTCGDDGRNPLDFGTSGVPVDASVYVLNRGAQAATALAGTITGGAFSFVGGAYPGSAPGKDWEPPPCGGALAAGQWCRLAIRFTPAGSGPTSGSASIAYLDGVSTVSAARGLTGTAVDHALVLVEDWPGQRPWDGMSPFDYGVAGQATRHQFTLENAGPLAATLAVPTLSPGFGFTGGTFPGQDGTCAAGALAAGANCTIDVSFLPAQLPVGPAAGTLTAGYGDGKGGNGSASRALTGTATNRAMVSILDWWTQGPNPGAQPYDFGTLGQPMTRSFYLVNTGAKDATLAPQPFAPTFSFAGGAFPGTGPVYPDEPPFCTTTLPKGQTCRVVVQFTPPAATQATFAGAVSVAVTDSLGAAGTATRALVATATDQPIVVTSDWPGGGGGGSSENGPPFDFGTTGQPIDHLFMLTNLGGGPATLLGGSTGGGLEWEFTGGGAFPGVATFGPDDPSLCGASLPAGSSCTVAVTFRPDLFVPAPGVAGPWPVSTQLTASYANVGGIPQPLARRSMSGTVTHAALLEVVDWWPGGSAWPGMPPFDYGVAGQVQEHAFVVSNRGGGAAVFGAATLPAGFRFTPDGLGVSAFPGFGSPPPGDPAICGATLAAGAACTVLVQLVPDGLPSDVPVSGSLDLAYDDGAGGTAHVQRGLTGTPTSRALLEVSEWFAGQTPSCDASGTCPWSFDPVLVGQNQAHQFWVTNFGPLDATSLASGGTVGAPFSMTIPATLPMGDPRCSGATVLAPGQSCRVDVTFAPVAAVTSTSRIGVAYGDAQGARPMASRQVTGRGQ